MGLSERKPHAAPILVRSPAAEATSSRPSPAATPAKATAGKKKPAAKKGLKKKGKASYDSTRGATSAEEEPEIDPEKWLEEQMKLTARMNRLYNGDDADGEEDEEEEDDEDDLLAFYDHDAEERALQEKIAELKRVSSLPAASEVSSSYSTPPPPTAAAVAAAAAAAAAAEDDAAGRAAVAGGAAAGTAPSPPLTDAASTPSETEEERDGAVASGAAGTSSPSPPSPDLGPQPPLADVSDAIEPFSIGRTKPSADFPEIEMIVPLASPTAQQQLLAQHRQHQPQGQAKPLASANAEPLTPRARAAAMSEPPMTPRSLASSIAARRQANQRMRSSVSAPTGA